MEKMEGALSLSSGNGQINGQAVETLLQKSTDAEEKGSEEEW